MWWLLVFAPADGTVGSVQNPADGGSGEAPLAVQSCEGLENAAFTNTTRQMNACFSHTNAKQILQAFLVFILYWKFFICIVYLGLCILIKYDKMFFIPCFLHDCSS